MGIAWYRAEEWPELLAAAADREDLEQTHAEWLQGAQRALVNFAAQGMAAQKIDVRIAELIQWCRQQQRPVDAPARSAYAAFKLRQAGQELPPG